MKLTLDPHVDDRLQAMLYATEGIDAESDLAKPMVGVANIWSVTRPRSPRSLCGTPQRPSAHADSLSPARSIRFVRLTGTRATLATCTCSASASASRPPCRRLA